MAEQMALFGIVVGIALLLSGIGFIILALGGASRRRELAPVVKREALTKTAAPANPLVPPVEGGSGRPRPSPRRAMPAASTSTASAAARAGRRLRDRPHSPGLELGVYVLVAPEPDAAAHEDDEVYVVLEGTGVLEIEGETVS